MNTPFTDEKIELDDSFAQLFENQSVYGGMMEKLYAASELWESIRTYDYYTQEELMVGNAFLTAEAAVGLAIEEMEGALNGASCLVAGFGRIGKALCLDLRGLGAKVDCCARKTEDLAAIRALGCEPLQYRQISKCYDVIFNTVPAKVLTALPLSRQSRETLVIELASLPGGVDIEAAKRLGIPRGQRPIPARQSFAKNIWRVYQRSDLQYDGGSLIRIDFPGERLVDMIKTVGFAMCGSFCTMQKAVDEMRTLSEQYAILPVMSQNVYETDTRFGKAKDFIDEVEKISGRQVLHSIVSTEPIGPKGLVDVMVVMPCTGNTLSKIANGITDTSVTMAVKSSLRIGIPVVLGLATNDAMGASGTNIVKLFNTKNVYLVPLHQDDPIKKTVSLVSDFSLLPQTIEAALKGRQLQPFIAETKQSGRADELSLFEKRGMLILHASFRAYRKLQFTKQ